MHHAEPETAVGERDDLVRPARPADVAPRVGDDHDLELEPLRRVDRQQPNGASALLLGDGLELLRAERVLLANEADEARDICAANRLVVAREAAELAQVREPAAAVPTGENGEVVVVLAEDPLAERLEPDAGRCAHESLVALEEGAQQALVAPARGCSGSARSSAVKSGRRVAFRRSSTSASFETPTNGEARTVASATSS